MRVIASTGSIDSMRKMFRYGEYCTVFEDKKRIFFAKYFELCCTIHHQWRNEEKRERAFKKRMIGKGEERERERLVRKRLGEKPIESLEQ